MNIIQKGMTIAVITLFIGVAVAPSINANVSKEALVEFTTEVCGLNGGKQTVKLTQEEADEVEVLFNSIRERLNATESREEAEEIFKEAVVELDKYGLLGGLSVEQVQRLVTFNSAIQRHYSPSEMDDNENAFCMIAGEIDDAYFVGPLSRPATIVSWIGYYGPMAIILSVIGFSLFFLTTFGFPIFPLRLGSLITVGWKWECITWSFHSSCGWIITIGLNGLKGWNGSLFGDIYLFKFVFNTYYVGVEGFFGMK